MADTTVSLFPQFMGQIGSGGTGGGTIIVGGLEVSVVDELLASIQMEIMTEESAEILVPQDSSVISVAVEREHSVTIEDCPS